MNTENSDDSSKRISTRELGKQLLEKLNAMGPDLSLVGKSRVILFNGHSTPSPIPSEQSSENTHVHNYTPDPEDTDEPISPARNLRHLRAQIYQEFKAGKSSNPENQKT